MKYGQTFQALLQENPAFAKWESSVVQYKALKKIINKITQELESAGLEADVLKQLLKQEQREESDDVHMEPGHLHVRADYELKGTTDAPAPCIKLTFSATQNGDALKMATEEELVAKLHQSLLLNPRFPESAQGFESTKQTDSAISQVSQTLEDQDEDFTALDESLFDGAQPAACEVSTPLLARLYGCDLVPASQLSPPGTPQAASEGSSNTFDEVDLPHLTLPQASLALPAKMEPSATVTSIVQRTISIPLPHDTKFFATLAETVASLQALEAAQSNHFQSQIQKLADSVRRVAAPKSRSDLYKWRDIFGLWIEAAIFEGLTEQDRGSRSTGQARQRLLWFSDQVGRRKLAASMRYKESRSSLESFIHLNESLTQLQEFVDANQTAVRKILKKHDKRTALTGSDAFSELVSAGVSSSSSTSLSLEGRISLCKVVSGSFTETLLPVVPQLDDVNCMICSEVAYRPIRLRRCGHKLCLKCLTELQRMKMSSCPVCRHPGVMDASTTDIDATLQAYVQLYFPKEARMIANQNDNEATQLMLSSLAGRPGAPSGRCAVS